jgi:DNA (cytosine-5)-methyltransferase 1
MKTANPIAKKLFRLSSDPAARLRVLDLFAGCGGLSLGFHAAGCEIVGAVEIDELAAQSHALNFYKDQPEDTIRHHARVRDITKIDPEQLIKEDLKLGSLTSAIDIIIGGPPCQAYARVGRAKLREIAEHPRAFKIDPRANLYLRYLHYIERLKPLALLMENVPDIMNFGGHNVVQEMVEALDCMGYVARYSLINSAHHGVPQMRDRVYMVAFHKQLGVQVSFPQATHHCRLPSGYGGTRSVAFKLLDMFSAGSYVEADTGTAELPPAITAEEAIGDLPPITLHREGQLRRGARRFTELARYRDIPLESLPQYARDMRTWPGFESRSGVYDHVLRYLPRDTVERVRKDTDRNYWMSASEAIDYGVANKIINSIKDLK